MAKKHDCQWTSKQRQRSHLSYLEFQVELDEELFRAVDAVVKLKGKELIEVVNAASLCDSSA